MASITGAPKKKLRDTYFFEGYIGVIHPLNSTRFLNFGHFTFLGCVFYYSLQYNQFEGKNLDFSRSSIPTVRRNKKYGVFRKHRTSRCGLL